MRDHLLDGCTYRHLSDADYINRKQCLEQEIKSWIKTYDKTLTKMECAFLKQGVENNKKAFAGFYLTLKAHKLKLGQNVTHLKADQSSHVLVLACSILWASGQTANYKPLPNNKYHIFATAMTSVKNYALPNIIRQQSSSMPMPSQCTPTYQLTLPSCLFPNISVSQYLKNDPNEMKHSSQHSSW